MSSDVTSTAWHIRNNDDTKQAILDLLTDNPGDLPSATVLAPGVVELATVAEAETGTDTTRAVTPQGVAAAIAAAGGATIQRIRMNVVATNPPTWSVSVNETGAALVVARASTGSFTITADQPVFLEDDTTVLCSADVFGASAYMAGAFRESDTVVRLQTAVNAGTLTDSFGVRPIPVMIDIAV